MSRKTLRRTHRRSFPWPLAAFGAGLLILAAVLFARNAGQPASATAASGPGGGKISADPAKLDYGYVPFGNEKSIRIRVTNAGNGPLRFTDQPYIEVVEGC